MTADRVLIGVLDASCPTMQITPLDSKIGGLPDCYKGCPITALPPCKMCCSLLHLLAQVYCPHEGSPYHRLMHIFCCLQPQCQGNSKSWMVLRSQEKEQEVIVVTVDKPVAKLMEDKWCDDEDDWSSLSSLSLIGNKSVPRDNHLTDKDSSKIGPPVHEDPAQVEQLLFSSCIPSHYIHVIEEPDDQLGAHNDKELARRVDGAIGNSDSSSEAYEKTSTKHGDKTFYKFHKRIARCPEQILRYQWNGIPLLVTTDSAIPPSPPSCQYCGSPRVFELQLMAPLVYLLKTRSQTDIEFGTVIVYTCFKSCWQDRNGFKEVIYLQSGPEDSQLTKLSIK
ncbi:programmed cell death protein 2-like [Dysidea avara]|uniref:programmed cell death protein 2-like n=1 Tax=Dysidea avara TaxID=196820 RepID=UPI00331FC2FA